MRTLRRTGARLSRRPITGPSPGAAAPPARFLRLSHADGHAMIAEP
jgi:hypothetical protein